MRKAARRRKVALIVISSLLLPSTKSQDVVMESKLQALKVVDLKKLLQDANLPVSGAKADLVKRLLENPEATSSLGGEEEEEDLLA